MSEVFRVMQNNNKKSFLFIIVLSVFFSSASVFGQNGSSEVSTAEVLINHNNIVIENPVKESNTVIINSNVNFILWFMGTKEDIGKTLSNDDVYSKKSFLTSGREPNRLLVKTLLKKAINIKSC